MATTRSVKGQTPGTGAQWKSPVENPEIANAEIAAVLSETAVLPVIDFPADDTVTLPGGLVRRDSIIKTAQVKELTGEDEETLARASQSMNPFVFLDRLLRCGVVRIGNEPVSETEKLLSQMLIGDREALILGIRKATYGEELEVPEWACLNCGVKSDLSMQLTDIPVVTMSDPSAETSFKVPLRKGGSAYVRLATGADQIATFEQSELTQAQRETLLLQRCVTTLVTHDGKELTVAGFPSLAREMSVPDRHAVLNQLKDRQPGPKYDQIKYRCDTCNEEVTVAVTIGHLFLDFGWV
jgi:hypothetical protein